MFVRRRKEEMSLLKKLFARKALDGLLQISDRIYVLNCCLSIDTLGEEEHRENLNSIIVQLKYFYSEASFTVLNFMQDKTQTKTLDTFSHFGISVTDYPSKFQKCPLVPLTLILHILHKSAEKLLSSDKTCNNILLLHCEKNAWPFLAFVLSSFLVFNKEANCEKKTLEMVYKRVYREILQSNLELNPQPSQLRYLQYVDKLIKGSLELRESHFILECVILRSIPNFDGERGCRPVLRVYGTDPLRNDENPKNIFSTNMIKKRIKYFKQGENNMVIKLNADCHIQGDVVIECVHVANYDSSTQEEETMFSFMFNTGFIQSNMVTFTLDDLDIAWNNGKDKFQDDFKLEVFFSDPIHYEPEIEEIESVADEFFDSEEIIRDTNNPMTPKRNPNFLLECEEDSFTHYDIHVVEKTNISEPEIKLELNNNEKTSVKFPDAHIIEHKTCINEGENSDQITKKSPRKSLLPPKIPPRIRVVKNNRKEETVTPKSKITIIPKRSTTPRTNVESKVAKLIHGDRNISNKPPKSPKITSTSTPPHSSHSPLRRSFSSPTHSTLSNYTPTTRRSSLASPRHGPPPQHNTLPRVKTRVIETKPPSLNYMNKDVTKNFNSLLTRSLSTLTERSGTGLSPRPVSRMKFGTGIGTGTSSGTNISELNRDGLKRSSSVSYSRSISAPKTSSSRFTRYGL